ncbi:MULTISPECIES: arylamine N-acetyltransferase [unclassified Exiguobacterium]|uniref:arylamine N-acetyltransferase family protein n=1 Tax=unclassified Exiguobacterium TaxID=2644629 RepID=UPI002036FAAE|nr:MULTISPECIES: arylamine N-acetyltransferase [unclassified Exiguobacterium]
MSSLMKKIASRIQFPLDRPITFDDLPSLLEAFAYHLPFDNQAVLSKRTLPFNEARLEQTFVTNQAGGVCYDLNHLLYEILRIQGFDVALVKATVYDNEHEVWSATGPTHVAILLQHAGATYLVDSGFGINLALRPVPLTGETVLSPSGSFRIAPNGSGYQLEMQRIGLDDTFIIGYHFYTQQTLLPEQLAAIEQIIQQHAASPFNKRSLLAVRTETGHRILTEQALTTWADGKKTIQPVPSDEQYASWKKELF